MKTIKIILFVAISAITSSINARSGEDTAKEMIKASKEVVSSYKESGVSGMIEKTTECYTEISKKMFYCGYLDLASRYIDLMVSKPMGFPQSRFFSDEPFSYRISQIFARANMDMDQANEYLRLISPEISKLVDIELSK